MTVQQWNQRTKCPLVAWAEGYLTGTVRTTTAKNIRADKKRRCGGRCPGREYTGTTEDEREDADEEDDEDEEGAEEDDDVDEDGEEADEHEDES